MLLKKFRKKKTLLLPVCMCHASHSKANSPFGFGKDFHSQKTKKTEKGGVVKPPNLLKKSSLKWHQTEITLSLLGRKRK